MFANWKEKRLIKKVKKNLTEREQAIFDFIYAHENGVSKSAIERATGYKMSGWINTKFKKVGIVLRVRKNKYVIEGIEL